MNDAACWAAWRDACRRPDVVEALGLLYDQIDQEVERASPACEMSGRCCRFETYGHRLYVTGLEIAWMLTRLGDDRRLPASVDPTGDCPWQKAGLCTVHAVRPMGCRLFFCDPNADQWQQATYERMLGNLRRLHERFALPYRYMEWRAGLGAAIEHLR